MPDAKVASLIMCKGQAVTVWGSFFLLWRVNCPKTFPHSSAWLVTASGNGDKRPTK
ncbi:MAG: hypothetical protein IJ338_02845 [Bacteroidaceae bacterium]|nr:hypothetical protein [Bacteroidaceae bacterium]